MRRVAHGTCWFPNETKQQVLALMQHQSSTMRCAYIGRRGMNIKERQVFEATQKADRSKDEKNISWNLEGRDEVIALSQKAWSWLQDCFLKPQVALLTGAGLVAGLQPAIGSSVGGIPASETPTTDRSLYP